VINDIDDSAASGAETPAGDPEDDFFSSWDKPTIKRPSNPPSRTATPPVVSRTASPFLTAGSNGNGTRPKSPLNGSNSPAPTSAPRTVSSTAIRKTATTAGARKPNILGGKKTKLGAKKVTADTGLDFEEAEKKAREEAERIAKLGYNPDDETEAAAAPVTKAVQEDTKIASPTPLSPGRGFGASKGHERSPSEVERLGMGVARLGFGQVGAAKSAAPPKKMGFGSTSRAVEGIHDIPARVVVQLTKSIPNR
jgi:ADP-ribosylation factor GTPase-activating protein 2/3